MPPILLPLSALLAAATLSAFLLKSTSSLPGCGPTSACQAVTTSRWSRLGSIPVAPLGMALYLTVALVLLFETLAAPNLILNVFLTSASAAILLAALWFIGLQLFVLRRLCLYCTLTHLAAVTGAILILLALHAPIPLATGIASALLLILLQILIPPQQYALTPAANLAPTPTATSPTSSANPSTPDSLTLVDGRITLNRNDWPLLGSLSAAHTIALLYDPTCHDCRDMYRTLLQATRKHPQTLAALAIPVPMHPACNATVLPAGQHHPDTCDYARLTLALWQTDPAIYRQYETWLLGKSAFPPLLEARGMANRHLGSRLTLALMHPQVENRLRAAVTLYQSARPDLLPQVLLQHSVLQGKVSAERIVELITLGA